MLFKLRKGERGLLDALLRDDRASRLSIQYMEGAAIGEDPDCIYVLVEGPEDLLEAAKGILGEGRILGGDEADRVLSKMRELEDRAAEGLGSIFG